MGNCIALMFLKVWWLSLAKAINDEVAVSHYGKNWLIFSLFKNRLSARQIADTLVHLTPFSGAAEDCYLENFVMRSHTHDFD